MKLEMILVHRYIIKLASEGIEELKRTCDIVGLLLCFKIAVSHVVCVYSEVNNEYFQWTVFIPLKSLPF